MALPLSQTERKAIRRLQKDLEEVNRLQHELPSISALPLENNVFEWHCNLLGEEPSPYAGVVIHLVLEFPKTYPFNPPIVQLANEIPHPSVFGRYICLDMLEKGEFSSHEERRSVATGWTSCYSVVSILRQLQAFLFDGAEIKELQSAWHRCSRCVCPCGHDMKANKLFPPFGEAPDEEAANVDENTKTGQSDVNGQKEVEKDTLAEITPMPGKWTELKCGPYWYDLPIKTAVGYGYFLGCGDKDGLLHNKEMFPVRALFAGTNLKVRVHSVAKGRIVLTEKPLLDLNALKLDTVVPGCVISTKPFGVFVDIGYGPDNAPLSGLLHRSEIDLYRGEPVPYQVGERIDVRVKQLEPLAFSKKMLYQVADTAEIRALPTPANVDKTMVACFHTKAGSEETILGVGVAIEEQEQKDRPVRKHLTSIFDFLSSEAFNDGVRQGVWKQPFGSFLPLAVDADHFKKALPSICSSIAQFADPKVQEATRSCGKKKKDDTIYISLGEYRAEQKSRRAAAEASTTASVSDVALPAKKPLQFNPVQVLEVLPKLMNSQVVLLMSGHLWTSEKALMGYMAFHHLFLALVERFPTLRAEVEKRLGDFVNTEAGRHKDASPNLGELLCLLTVSDTYSWRDMCQPMLEEVFDRHALWVLKQYPALVELADVGPSSRLEKSFKSNVISMRLLMFQVRFLLRVKGAHLHTDVKSSCHKASCRLDAKHATNGLPTQDEVVAIFDECREILELKCYNEFLAAMGVGDIDDENMCRWLRRAMLNSYRKGYHKDWVFRGIVNKRYAKKSQKDEDDYDPDDCVVDAGPKKTAAEKRKQREHADMVQAAHRPDWLVQIKEEDKELTLNSRKDVDALLQKLKSPEKWGAYFTFNDVKISTRWVLLEPYNIIILERATHRYPITLRMGGGCYSCKRNAVVHNGMCTDCRQRLFEKRQNQVINVIRTEERKFLDKYKTKNKEDNEIVLHRDAEVEELVNELKRPSNIDWVVLLPYTVSHLEKNLESGTHVYPLTLKMGRGCFVCRRGIDDCRLLYGCCIQCHLESFDRWQKKQLEDQKRFVGKLTAKKKEEDKDITLNNKKDVAKLVEHMKNPSEKLIMNDVEISANWVVLEPYNIIKLERTTHKYPLTLKVGVGCLTCKKAVVVRNGRCPNCLKREVNRKEKVAIKGLTRNGEKVLSERRVYGWKVPYSTPSWEVTLHVSMVPGVRIKELKELRRAVDDNLNFIDTFTINIPQYHWRPDTVGGDTNRPIFKFITTLVQSSSNDEVSWKHASPEWSIPIGARIEAIWVREEISVSTKGFKRDQRTERKRREMTLGVDTWEEFEKNIKFRTTYCTEHIVDKDHPKDDDWAKVCGKCRGTIVFRVRGPETYDQRRTHLMSMSAEELGERAELLGLTFDSKPVMIKEILKAERIIQ